MDWWYVLKRRNSNNGQWDYYVRSDFITQNKREALKLSYQTALEYAEDLHGLWYIESYTKSEEVQNGLVCADKVCQ